MVFHVYLCVVFFGGGVGGGGGAVCEKDAYGILGEFVSK